jgi:hypothetical protein
MIASRIRGVPPWLVVLLLGVAAPALAAEEPAGGQSLEQAASDPTASLMSLQVQDVYAPSYHRLDDESGNTLLLRSALPFMTAELSHIARLTLPVITDSPSGADGLGDLVLFDLVVFERAWGRWGVGPVMLAPTASNETLGAEKWAAGPAIGFTARSGMLMWGLFDQNLFSFAGEGEREDVNLSILQPILNYSLPRKWSVGTSEMNLSYDWERGEWIALPLGVKLAKLVKFSGLPVQFAGAGEYNFDDDEVIPEWTFSLTAKLLFPI